MSGQQAALIAAQRVIASSIAVSAGGMYIYCGVTRLHCNCHRCAHVMLSAAPEARR